MLALHPTLRHSLNIVVTHKILFTVMLAAALPFLGWSADAGKAATKKPSKKKSAAADLFEKKRVLSIQMDLSDNEWNALQRDNRRYARATVREGTNVWSDVGVHLKGAAGSSRGLDDKPALTLHFSKFTPDQQFYGLKKLHLNNSVQDGSYMTEEICGELFRQAGVPAARATYATLELKGRKRGLYVLKEGFEKEMLSLYFKNTKGNLYDGGFLREITEELERDNGEGDDVDNWADLKELAKAAQEPDASRRFEALSKVLDVDRFISFTAVETMVWDWDGYVMKRNNYRVFHDMDAKKMVFLPHGMDQMFWQPDGPIMPPMEGLVAQALIRTPQGGAMYFDRFGQLFTNVFRLEVLTNRVAELAALVRPALTNSHGPHAGSEYDGQVSRIRDLIIARHAYLARQLNTPRPKPIAFENGVAKVTGWRIPENIQEQGNARRDKPAVDSRKTLHIQTASSTSASWRAPVLLEAGRYRFEAMARTSGVSPITDSQKGEGAGIRISGSTAPRSNKLIGDSAWKKISYEFDAVPGVETVLVCELRASKGEVWFDAESLHLIKLK